MRSIKNYIIIALAALCVGCETEDDTNTSQSTTIESYLEGSHSPKLVSSTIITDDYLLMYPDAHFYTRYGNYAYRYISTYYDDGRDTWSKVKSGSRIGITFSLYEFSGSTISSSTLPAYSNDPDNEQDYIDAGLNTTYWDFSPLYLTVGSDNTFPALHDAFIGCCEGDEVEIYTTYLMGYESVMIGTIDKESSMVMFLKIESVN